MALRHACGTQHKEQQFDSGGSCRTPLQPGDDSSKKQACAYSQRKFKQPRQRVQYHQGVHAYPKLVRFGKVAARACKACGDKRRKTDRQRNPRAFCRQEKQERKTKVKEQFVRDAPRRRVIPETKLVAGNPRMDQSRVGPKKSRSWRGTGIGACTQRDKTEAQEKSNQMRGPDASHSRQPELIDAVPAVHLGIDPGHDEARENKEKRDCLMKGEVLHAARQAVKMTACMTNHYQQCGKKAHGCEGPEFAGWALAGWLRQNRSVARVDMGRKTGYDLRAQFVYPVWKRISSSCEVG